MISGAIKNLQRLSPPIYATQVGMGARLPCRGGVRRALLGIRKRNLWQPRTTLKRGEADTAVVGLEGVEDDHHFAENARGVEGHGASVPLTGTPC